MRAFFIHPLGLLLALLIPPLFGASPEGELAHWKFDEGQGDLAEDGSGHGYAGDIAGAEWAKGDFGTALHFGGKDAYVTVPQINGLDGSPALTLEAWVLWETGGRYPNILSGGQWAPGGFLLFVADRNCSFRMGRPGARPDGPAVPWKEASAPLLNPFETGKWYHLAATFQRPVITTYVNGRKTGSAQWDYPVGYEGPLEIGRWSGPVCHQGLIDEVRIFQRALSAEEVQASFAAEAPRRLAPAQAAYTLSRVVAQPMAAVENSLARLEIDRRGRCLTLVEKRSGKNLLASPAPLVTAKIGGRPIRPVTCSFEDQKLHLDFGVHGVKAVIGCQSKDRYFTFTVLSLEGEGVESLTFVSLALPPAQHSSQTSGLAAGDDWGVCLRALNLQTEVSTGGSPAMARAYCGTLDGLTGAQAGLVVAPPDLLRPVLQDMVKAEGLPQSRLGGPWALESEDIRGSYLFGTPGERDVDRWIQLAKRGGFTHLHHSSWYQTLGHYEPSPSLFPSGMEGLKAVVAKIHASGLKAGMHTLTGCIDPRDPWVTPVPDPRLAADASYTLAAGVDETSATLLTLEKPQPHDVIWSYSGRGNALRIGDEIIQYAAISYEPPYGFLQCTRGAFKTKPAVHEKGGKVDHLRQVYLAFYPDERSTLVGEVADAIARVYNQCEFDQIYMDGAEGMGSNHGIQIMRDAIYQRLQRPAVVEASAWDHWSWYYHSRIGAWDHPKWGLKPFTDRHCAAIDGYRKGALLQAQLGWWVVLGPSYASHAETPDEMEYFCAKGLAFDAPSSTQGIGSLTSPANARMQEYITMAGWYERLRLANYFPESVLQQLREPGKDFHLTRDADGAWQLRPTSYLAHKVTGLDDGSGTWTVTNAFPSQPLQFRLEALFAVAPFDSPDGVVIADADRVEQFTVRRAASGVTHALERSADQVKTGPASLRFTASSKRKTGKGAWAQAGMRFEPPYLSIKPCDALGLWIHGDGKGEILNLQLTSPREYMVAYGEHYVTVDFTGWRYFELPLRERDAARYSDYEWPYFSLSGIYMTAVNQSHVDGLNLYLNNLPPDDTATVYLGPIKALRTSRMELRQPAIVLNGQKLVIPTTLTSGDYVELASLEDCRVYDERGQLLDRLVLSGSAPRLEAGDNLLAFSCDRPAGSQARAELTTLLSGPPLTDRTPDRQIRWALLRDEYDLPRVISKLDGRDNSWEVLCRKGEKSVPFSLEIDVEEVKASEAVYLHSGALTLESFDDASFGTALAGRIVSVKPGVTQSLECRADQVKAGQGAACYAATSTLADNGGWSVWGRRLAQTLDLSGFQGIGFWLYGDGKGEAFKFQLRDEAGGWCDMVTPVDFAGWRYVQFDFARPGNLNRAKIRDVLLYYNSIPAGQTVTCRVDDIRALPSIPGLRNPELSLGGQRLIFPVELWSGDRLVYEGRACQVFRKTNLTESITPQGAPWALPEGRSRVELSFAKEFLPQFRVSASLVKHYAR